MLLVREVHDPGIGFVTLTRVKMTPDLQLARVYYTIIGDERARKETQRALDRATPFLRRQIGARVRLRRVPELRFEFDVSVEHQDRVERILMELAEERKKHPVQIDDETPVSLPDGQEADAAGVPGDDSVDKDKA